MKKYLLAFLLAAALTMLCACGEAQKTPTNSDEPQGTGVVSPAQDSQQPQTIHMSETLCDGLAIDADIPVQESLALSTYQANYFRISAADAVSLLVGGSKIKTEEPHHYDPNGFNLVLESGAQIFHANGILTYSSETEDWDREIADLLLRNLRPNTQMSYERRIYQHIIPALGNIQIDKLTTKDIQQFYTKLKQGGRLLRSLLCLYLNPFSLLLNPLLNPFRGRRMADLILAKSSTGNIPAPLKIDRYVSPSA